LGKLRLTPLAYQTADQLSAELRSRGTAYFTATFSSIPGTTRIPWETSWSRRGKPDTEKRLFFLPFLELLPFFNKRLVTAYCYNTAGSYFSGDISSLFYLPYQLPILLFLSS